MGKMTTLTALARNFYYLPPFSAECLLHSSPQYFCSNSKRNIPRLNKTLSFIFFKQNKIRKSIKNNTTSKTVICCFFYKCYVFLFSGFADR